MPAFDIVLDCVHNAFIAHGECQMLSAKKEAAISVRLSKAKKKAAQNAAEEHCCSVTSMVEQVLTIWLKKAGYLK